jgi:hypothetical protein
MHVQHLMAATPNGIPLQNVHGVAPAPALTTVNGATHTSMHMHAPPATFAMTPKDQEIMAQIQMLNMQLSSNQIQIANAAQNEGTHADDDTKENAGDTNVTKQLEDAKLRIEDAKRFIMSRSNRRAMSPMSNLPPMINNHPGAQLVKPGMSMMTPTTVGIHPGALPGPGAQSGIFRKNSSMTGTPQRAPTPEMRVMGSLMSAESDHNDEVSPKETAEADPLPPQDVSPQAGPAVDPPMSSSPGMGEEGYASPKVPGRYFFA